MGPAADLFCEMLSGECGIPDSVSRPVYTELMGRGPKAQFDAVLRRVEAWDEALVEDLTQRYWLSSEADVPDLFSDVMEALEDLHREGYTLVVSSGSIPRSVERKLRATGIERFFQIALGSDEDSPALSKGPGHFAMIADALSLSPTELSATGVFIGDGVYDMQVARQADMLAVGRLTGDNGAVLKQAGAHHVIASLGELHPFLDTP